MTNTIQRAVELASGWKILQHSDIDEHAQERTTEVIWSPGMGSHRLSDPGQATLDALAAQLTRQVDATKKCRYEVFVNAADTAIKDGAGGKIIAQEWGKDRTLNTIRAIVDSKVLICPPHDFVSLGDGTAKCHDCHEQVDISETGAAR